MSLFPTIVASDCFSPCLIRLPFSLDGIVANGSFIFTIFFPFFFLLSYPLFSWAPVSFAYFYLSWKKKIFSRRNYRKCLEDFSKLLDLSSQILSCFYLWFLLLFTYLFLIRIKFHGILTLEFIIKKYFISRTKTTYEFFINALNTKYQKKKL